MFLIMNYKRDKRLHSDCRVVFCINVGSVEQIFKILILSGNIEPGKSICLLNIASFLPSGKINQNVQAWIYRNITF